MTELDKEVETLAQILRNQALAAWNIPESWEETTEYARELWRYKARDMLCAKSRPPDRPCHD